MEALMDGDSLGAVVARARMGDELAFARIVAAHHDDMTRVCFVICGDADLAQEAVQAAWPHAWQKMTTIRDPQRLRPWLISIAVNETKQLVRKRGRRMLREIAIDPETSGGVAASARSLRMTRVPSRSGKPRSSTTRSGRPCSQRSKAARASSASWTS